MYQNQPGHDNQTYGNIQYGSPQYGQPNYGSPQHGQPNYGSPQYGQPAYPQNNQGGYPPAYLHQPQPPQQVLIINTNTHQNTNYCLTQRMQTPTRIQYYNGGKAMMWFWILFVIGCFCLVTWLFCWVPFCMDDCKDKRYVCANCGTIKHTEIRL